MKELIYGGHTLEDITANDNELLKKISINLDISLKKLKIAEFNDRLNAITRARAGSLILNYYGIDSTAHGGNAVFSFVEKDGNVCKIVYADFDDPDASHAWCFVDKTIIDFSAIAQPKYIMKKRNKKLNKNVFGDVIVQKYIGDDADTFDKKGDAVYYHPIRDASVDLYEYGDEEDYTEFYISLALNVIARIMNKGLKK